MSPEQARGLAVDRRADIWAFGVLLWEMLTAKRPFPGATLSDIFASLLKTEPDWTTLPADTPASIQRLLRRSLQKDSKLRLDSAVVARLEIDEALTSPAAATGTHDVAARGVGWPRLVPWLVAGVVTLGMTTLLVRWSPRANPVEPTHLRLSAELGADAPLRKDLGAAAILSPDGQTLVFATLATAVPSLLYVRRLDELTATPLRGTENASNPFFSFDGEWIGFFADGQLKKISLAGGMAVTICAAPSGRGGTWAEDGSIVFASSSAPQSVLDRVSSAGGIPSPLTSLAEGEISHRWPQMLPGDTGVLYTSNTSENWDDARVMVQPLPAGTAKVVHPGFYGRYVPSGHLVYLKGGTLYATPFDLKRLEVTGPSVPVLEGVAADTSTGGGQFALSETGTVVFLRGRGFSSVAPTAWMDRAGNTTPLHAARADWNNPQFSPNGERLAVDIRDVKQTDVWVQDHATAKLSRLTFDSAEDFKPTWTPDGRRIAFTSTRDGPANLYWQRADGAGNVQRLTHSANAQGGASWHPAGNFMAFQEVHPQTRSDVMILPFDRDGASGWKAGSPTVFAGGPFNEFEPMFSPDGRWLAYHSTETGRAEVFVQPFPGGGGKWQVSSGGGRDATWSRARPELLYFGVAQNQIMVAPYTAAGDSLRLETARAWSNEPVGRPARVGRTFDLHPDGDRVVIVPVESKEADHITLVFNFFDELRQIARVTK